MKLQLHLEVVHAWRGALVAAGLNMVGMPIDLALGHEIPGMPWWPALMSSAVGAGLIGVLLVWRARATVRVASVIFLINTVVILVALWVTSGYYARSSPTWTPFQANKLGILAVPLLAPDLLVGLVCIAAHVAMVIARFYTFDHEIQQRMPVGEPWIICIYGMFGGALVAYRLRGLALEREAARLHSQAAAADELARMCLALRDAINTPIQTIRLSTMLFRFQSPAQAPLIDRVDRAAARLTELSAALTQYESKLRWRPGDESLGPHPTE